MWEEELSATGSFILRRAFTSHRGWKEGRVRDQVSLTNEFTPVISLYVDISKCRNTELELYDDCLEFDNINLCRVSW